MELKRFGEAMIHIDVSSGDIQTKPCPADWTRKYIGARGLGVRYVFEAGPEVEPLSFENLPQRFLDEASTMGGSKGHCSELDEMLGEYYAARGWENGVVPESKLRELEIL
jgi:aldehyde:ferredoxin oxidoreductase